VIIASKELIEEARSWVRDCAWKEEPEELDEMTDQEILVGVHKHYEGGLLQFARNSDLDPPENVPEWRSRRKR
jgi:hypothetical protein